MNYIGFRWWRVWKDSDLHMQGLVIKSDWTVGGITRASHYGQAPVYGTHPVPKSDCVCGLHAWRTLEGAMHGDWGQGTVSTYLPKDDSTILVAGAVLTGGLVCVHGDEGLRAQQAIPVAFGVESRRSIHPYVRALSECFGAPVFEYASLQRYAGEFGERIPSFAR